MRKLRYSKIVALAVNNETAIVTLSPFSIALLSSLLQEPYEVFIWSEMTDEEKDEAGDAIAQALGELLDGA